MTERELPRVTIVVTQRERFSAAEEALHSLYALSDIPFDLVYVDGNSPSTHAAWLAEQARRHGFRLLRQERYLAPNEARNLGLASVRTPYVLFIDNDIICAPGWLSRLVRTADETGAEVITPLICQGLPAHSEIHQAGARIMGDIEGFFTTQPGKRILFEEIGMQGLPVAAAPAEPVETQCCEFHCILVRRDFLDRLGPFDEEMMATKDHVDFSIGILASGGRVLLEPRAIVTYNFPCRARPMTLADWPFFMVRWAEERQRRSIARLTKKWGLDPDQPFLAERYGHAKWRWEEGLVKPLVRKVPLTQSNRTVRRIVRKVIATAVFASGTAVVRRHEAAAGGAERPSSGPA